MPIIEDLREEDFQPMATFPLRWRFAEDRKWNILPATALEQIQCFQPAKAAELERYCRHFATGYGLDGAQFENIVVMDTSGTAEEGRTWLREGPPGVETRVFVVWNSECAVLTTWGVFRAYWDDFCYPVSDDVLVWPESEQWALFYFHHEALHFGMRRA